MYRFWRKIWNFLCPQIMWLSIEKKKKTKRKNQTRKNPLQGCQ
jgi:hypothetical protein